MRTRHYTLSLVAAVLLAVAGAVPFASAQAPVPLEGTVKRAGSNEPVEGAVIVIFRTDIKGKYETKTDKKGNFTYPVPMVGTYVVGFALGAAAQKMLDENLKVEEQKLKAMAQEMEKTHAAAHSAHQDAA